MSSETVVISWNVTNWITVILMALAGWVVWRFITNLAKSKIASAE